MMDAWKPSASVHYRLKQADGALNFAYTNLGRANALEYHTRPLTTGFGDRFDLPPGAAATHQITAEGVDLSAGFLELARSKDGGVILVEARSNTTAPLTLTVEQDGVVLAEARVMLRISSVEDLYRHVNLTGVAKSYDGRSLKLPDYVPPTRTNRSRRSLAGPGNRTADTSCLFMVSISTVRMREAGTRRYSNGFMCSAAEHALLG
jgi:hypothetical protein